MAIFQLPLTPYPINVLIQQMTIAALGLPSNSFSKVRVGWQTFQQPASSIDEDICYIRSVEEDDEYNRDRDMETQNLDDDTVLVLTKYTRVWRTFWTFYGPSSFDRARLMRSMLFSSPSHDTLASYQLYLVTDPAAPQRVPEIFEQQWWERVDFSAQFNEAVVEQEITGFIKSAEILIQGADGVEADITVSN